MRLSRLLNHFRSDRVSDEIDREMAFHIAERTDALVASGMSREDAEREARRMFGNYGMQKEAARDRDLFAPLDGLVADLRHALRALRASPVFTLVAVLSLALGIGANTAIFSLIDAIMLESLPVARPAKLAIFTRGAQQAGARNDKTPTFSPREWEHIHDARAALSPVVASVFAYGATGVELSTGGESRRVSAGFVSGEFFSALGTTAALGRLLAHDDDVAGCAGAIVISHAFWQSEFGGARDVVGKTLPLDGHPLPIVGVAEPKFFGVEIGFSPPVWVPLCAEPIIRDGGNGRYAGGMGRLVMARIADNASFERARAQIATLGPSILSDSAHAGLDVVPFAKGIPELRRGAAQTLWVLMAAVGLVLLVACANVANLLIARGMARQHEIAIRLALGASRARLIRLLLTENLTLAFLGTAFGALFAAWGCRALVALMSPPQQRVSLDLSPNSTVLGFTIALAVVSGILFGLAPAWRAAHVDPNATLKPLGRGMSQGRARLGAGKALVVAQVALSLLIVAGAGLLLGTWRRLATLDPGFRRDGVLLATIGVRNADLAAAQRPEAFHAILDRLRAIPGVVSASASGRTPIGNSSWRTTLAIPGTRIGDEPEVELNEVSDRYLATFGIRLLAGRDFSASDLPSSQKVAIISERLAANVFGGRSAIGKRFRARLGGELSPPIEIVGIAASTRQTSLRQREQPMVYFALSQNTSVGTSADFALATSGLPASLSASVTAALRAIDRRYAVGFATLEQQLDRSLRTERSLAILSGLFGALALLLAAMGLYGIVAYGVARRRREIGVRIALGATRRRVVRMVLRDMAALVGTGIVLGAMLTVASTRALASLLYELTPTDPATLGAAAGVLVIIGIAAAMAPAWHASRLDPVAALRED